MLGADMSAVDVVEIAIPGLGADRQQPLPCQHRATRLTQEIAPVWQGPTACVFDSSTGRLNDPASSIQVVPVISPLPLNECQPAAHG